MKTYFDGFYYICVSVLDVLVGAWNMVAYYRFHSIDWKIGSATWWSNYIWLQVQSFLCALIQIFAMSSQSFKKIALYSSCHDVSTLTHTHNSRGPDFNKQRGPGTLWSILWRIERKEWINLSHKTWWRTCYHLQWQISHAWHQELHNSNTVYIIPMQGKGKIKRHRRDWNKIKINQTDEWQSM